MKNRLLILLIGILLVGCASTGTKGMHVQVLGRSYGSVYFYVPELSQDMVVGRVKGLTVMLTRLKKYAPDDIQQYSIGTSKSINTKKEKPDKTNEEWKGEFSL